MHGMTVLIRFTNKPAIRFMAELCILYGHLVPPRSLPDDGGGPISVSLGVQPARALVQKQPVERQQQRHGVDGEQQVAPVGQAPRQPREQHSARTVRDARGARERGAQRRVRDLHHCADKQLCSDL